MDITTYTRSDYRSIWNDGQYLEKLEPLLNRIDAESDNYYNHHDEPYARYHILDWDCMFDKCIEKLHEQFYKKLPVDKSHCNFNENDLEWYYIPHYCDLYSILTWQCLQYAFPDCVTDILYYPDHFVCIDQINKKIYDLQYDIWHDKEKYHSLTHIQSRGGFYIFESSQIQKLLNSTDKIELYEIMNKK